jgi:urease accessory protein
MRLIDGNPPTIKVPTNLEECHTRMTIAKVDSEQRMSNAWHGNLELIYGVRSGATQLLHDRSQAPFKLQRSFYPEGSEICHNVILHTAGGMVGGDRLSMNLHLQPQAQALITTAAASKLYRSNGQEAQQTIQVRVAEGACLEWLPQETIVFDQAIYRQDMRIELAAEAQWLGWEITRFGRTARGEQFLAGNWRSHTEVWQAGKPLWIDRQWLPGSPVMVESPHGLANCPIVGSFAYIGQVVEPELVTQARSLWQGSSGEIGVTRLMSGLLCRYRGHSTSEVRQWFLAVWQLLRLSYLGRSTCLPRVWQL